MDNAQITTLCFGEFTSIMERNIAMNEAKNFFFLLFTSLLTVIRSCFPLFHIISFFIHLPKFKRLEANFSFYKRSNNKIDLYHDI